MDAQRSSSSPAHALLLVATVWCVLAGGARNAAVLGAELASLQAFAYATFLAITVHVRAQRRSSRLWPTTRKATQRARTRREGIACLIAAALCGAAAHTPLRDAILSLGLGLGLPPVLASEAPPYARAAAPTAATLLSALVLAPIFEEIVYRERLLFALAPRWGYAVSIAVSSLLFALPHVETWAVFGALVVGAVLGCAAIAARTVSVCIALHAGLNAAACLEAAGWGIGGVRSIALLGSAAGAVALGRMAPRRRTRRIRARATWTGAGAGVQ
jgi:membrane protease YdiL (CAAX protease family)